MFVPYRRALAALIVAAAAFGSACGGVVQFEADPDEGQGSTSTTVPGTPTDPSADPAAAIEQVTALPGRAEVVSVPVDDLEATVDGNRIMVRPVWTAVDACHGLERIDVTPAPGGVFTITVWEGLEPGVDPAAPQCQAPARQRSTLVDLGSQPSGTYAVTGAVTEDTGGEGAGATIEVEVP